LVSNTHSRFHSIHGWALSALGIASTGESEVEKYEALVDSFVREYAQGRRTLLIFDEAQNLSADALEELRLLSNVNSEKDLVLQVLLVGQPELRQTLSRPDLRQFAQRISVDFHLRPLDVAESQAYIRHRLLVAQGDADTFMPDTIEFIHRRTSGIPRLINQLCDIALVYAFADGRTRIDRNLMHEVVGDQDSRRMVPSEGGPSGLSVRSGR
jgi:type II secretory pathway predicted ATPase ExeA